MNKTVLLILLLGVLFSAMIQGLPLQVHASPDQYASFVITGGGMRPTIQLGDLITVKTDITASQIQASSQPDGDIIVFNRPKSSSSDTDVVVAHRAIEKVVNSQTGTTFFKTKGDNNADLDSFVSDFRGENYSWNDMVSEKLLIGEVVGISRSSSLGVWDGRAYNVTVYTNSTATVPVFSQSDKKIRFDITGYISFSNTGFCNMTIPKAILSCSSLADWQVKLNLTDMAYTASDNETHTFIYFTYGYSINHVEITGTQSIEQQTTSKFPSAVVLGRYNCFSDNYWIVYNKTVQQLRNEGYDVSGDANWLAYVNYTNLGYTFKSKVVRLSWPNATLQLTEGAHDLNVTAFRIMDDGSLGESLGSFLKTNLPPYVHPYPLEVKDPDLGVGFDPAALIIGNAFPTSLLTFTVNRTENLTGTPWGQNNTYVSLGYFANATHSYDWTTWSDSESGLFLKLVVKSRTPTFTSYEEHNLIITAVELDRFEIVKNSQSYQVRIDTNSTLNDFVFDPDANRINLTVEGAADTSGILNVTVPKGLVPAGYGFEVLIDYQATSYTLTEDTSNYYVGVSYHHSIHTITIGFVATALWDQWWFWPTIAAIIAVVVAAAYFLWKRRTKKTHDTK